MKRKPKQTGTIPADHLMIIAALRYCLGRRTYIVKHCSDWIVENWGAISDQTKSIIRNDVEEAFSDDDKSRLDGGKYHPLGMDFDRGAWASVRRLYREPICCQCGKSDIVTGIIHIDGEVSCNDCYDGKCAFCGEPVTGWSFTHFGRKIRHPGCG